MERGGVVRKVLAVAVASVALLSGTPAHAATPTVVWQRTGISTGLDTAIFSADETADVGQDDSTTVTDDYKEGDNKFTGKILKVTIQVK